MKYMAAVLLAFGLLLCGCMSSEEVVRVTSPDGRVDAILVETNCGAPCSFGYEVGLARKGKKGSEEVAVLDAATRNDQAWGVNLSGLAQKTYPWNILRQKRQN